MKKLALSLIVIISFTIFSFYQRLKPADALPVILPKKISSVTPSVTATPVATKSTPSAIPSAQTPVQVSDTPTSTPAPTAASGYRDGSYTGDPADAFYGTIQVKAVIKNGKITDVQFLQYPNDRSTSVFINSQADPMLTQEAIQVQNANVDIVSGATDSSQAFIQSLQSALDQAKQ